MADRTIILRFADGKNPIIEFNDVSVADVLAAPFLTERECNRILNRIEYEEAIAAMPPKQDSGIVPVVAMPADLHPPTPLKGRTS